MKAEDFLELAIRAVDALARLDSSPPPRVVQGHTRPIVTPPPGAPPRPSARVVVRGTRRLQLQPSRRVVVPVPPRTRRITVVTRENTPYWKERGWRKIGNTYEGNYSVNGRSWRGYIEEPYPGGFQIHIYNPPKELRRHRKWICFIPQDDDEHYIVHLTRQPQNVDGAIFGVERLIGEAIQPPQPSRPSVFSIFGR